jgi:acylphosphatase
MHRSDDERQIARRWSVSGRVQGVGFRFHVFEAAHRAGVNGDVRNLPDGTVEIRAVGTEDRLRHLLEQVRRGPARARVEDVREQPWDARDRFERFSIR